MAKVRLTKAKREWVLGRLSEKIKKFSLKEESAILEDAKKALNERAKVIIEAKYPKADMAILQKYNAITLSNTLVVENDTYDYITIYAIDSYSRPTSYDCPKPYVSGDDPIFELFKIFKDAKSAYDAAYDRIFQAYRDTVYLSKTLSDLQAIIPEVSEMTDIFHDVNQNPLMVLDNPSLDIVKADVAKRAENEAA